ncbi:MAG: hypothetical protein PHE67_03760 [Campylobacterales bacterium]|nr:hypothetical protein [Campylobacterales bacterium]
MNFIEFLADDIFIMLLFFPLIFVLLFFLLKGYVNKHYLKLHPSKPQPHLEEKEFKEESHLKEDPTNSLKIPDESKAIFDALGDVDFSNEHLQTDMLLANKIDRQYLENGSYKDECPISGELLRVISEELDLRQGGIVNFIKRIDDKGKIIFPLDALDFISKKHKPLIMPDGSIRVLNFLTIEENIFSAIKHKAPIFYIDKKEGVVKKLDQATIGNLVALDEKMEQAGYIKKLEKEVKELGETNKLLNKEVENIQDSLFNSTEREKILIHALEGSSVKEPAGVNMTKIKEQSASATREIEQSIFAKKESLLGEDSSTEKNDDIVQMGMPRRNRKQKKEHQEQKKEVSSSPALEENSSDETEGLDAELIVVEKEVPEPKEQIVIETQKIQIISQDDQDKKEDSTDDVEVKRGIEEAQENQKGEIKRVTKKDLKKIQEALFSEAYLLSDEVLDNSKGKPSEQIFISSFLKDSKLTLFLNKKNLFPLVRRVLDDLYGQYNRSPQEIVEWLECDTIIDKYFAIEGVGNKIYHAAILKLEINEELIYGLKLNKRFTPLFSKEDLSNEIAINEGKRKVFYEDLLDILKRGVYEKI